MDEVEVFVEIDAPPAVVWDALRSFEAYPEWDPIGRTVEGVSVGRDDRRGWSPTPGRGRRSVESSVVAVEPDRRLAWLDRFVVPFALDRYHEFRLEPIEDGRRTRLLQRETVRGALVPLVFDRARVERAFVAMNEAIAARAERAATATA
ncbi:SRPBCC domain-containing protein [Natrinema marinum]|uniref:SRPBCC domain-containing protein n=1 Tax=Natrinema marinum TaxID=2961598 RepID=UPI0020C891E4|nr:SRPBCC domain-containing protein [Natrinema marinum]